ncbi:unnamed protein product [Vitrella brassicaformis CCMP3155]|uniref:Uncharacterized protein n=1 Tax=Vitrella brassicaformis (strain CCMP3155) TaxID=1169540 RepID=A0A0G4GYX9_VITBC|nr:unnamed protein product [Vitrella brassicaformis CCMP3155]|eukprot:CEM36145.1 unnamed protein product [Vitrella brassicaformis CCMP3155]
MGQGTSSPRPVVVQVSQPLLVTTGERAFVVVDDGEKTVKIRAFPTRSVLFHLKENSILTVSVWTAPSEEAAAAFDECTLFSEVRIPMRELSDSFHAGLINLWLGLPEKSEDGSTSFERSLAAANDIYAAKICLSLMDADIQQGSKRAGCTLISCCSREGNESLYTKSLERANRQQQRMLEVFHKQIALLLERDKALKNLTRGLSTMGRSPRSPRRSTGMGCKSEDHKTLDSAAEGDRDSSTSQAIEEARKARQQDHSTILQSKKAVPSTGGLSQEPFKPRQCPGETGAAVSSQGSSPAHQYRPVIGETSSGTAASSQGAQPSVPRLRLDEMSTKDIHPDAAESTGASRRWDADTQAAAGLGMSRCQPIIDPAGPGGPHGPGDTSIAAAAEAASSTHAATQRVSSRSSSQLQRSPLANRRRREESRQHSAMTESEDPHE